MFLWTSWKIPCGPNKWAAHTVPAPMSIATWAAANDLKLIVLKSKEIIFQNSTRRTVTPQQPLPNISRENVLKIIGITITNHLSASEHIRRVISDSAQSSLYALRVPRHHGLTEIGLHFVKFEMQADGQKYIHTDTPIVILRTLPESSQL